MDVKYIVNQSDNCFVVGGNFQNTRMPRKRCFLHKIAQFSEIFEECFFLMENSIGNSDVLLTWVFYSKYY